MTYQRDLHDKIAEAVSGSYHRPNDPRCPSIDLTPYQGEVASLVLHCLKQNATLVHMVLIGTTEEEPTGPTLKELEGLSKTGEAIAELVGRLRDENREPTPIEAEMIARTARA